jgi:hypothetical protein
VSLLFDGIEKKALISIKEKITAIYSHMDTAYREAASSYGFTCSGCDHNCCEERFFHYAVAEHLYLAAGISSLIEDTKKEITARAEEVIQIYGIHDLKGIIKRVMCPLNFAGLCILYDYRPMICRLHGISHTLKKPGFPEQQGPGCHTFDEDIESKNKKFTTFDRTVFYAEMAAVEIKLRKLLKFGGRYKKTVAGMILDISESDGNSL